jgi:hypothetical protein
LHREAPLAGPHVQLEARLSPAVVERGIEHDGSVRPVAPGSLLDGSRDAAAEAKEKDGTEDDRARAPRDEQPQPVPPRLGNESRAAEGRAPLTGPAAFAVKGGAALRARELTFAFERVVTDHAPDRSRPGREREWKESRHGPSLDARERHHNHFKMKNEK